ncbi:MAG: 4Fe-4S dicluster domain-containing protein [Bacteroidetes bacterium]|jgi:molybdopterin-containing oxidoreductase family iron-sulfur binding subunit|nr:4Fe-4S dicluster domain-containing protein [Bacteroidota bacterium]
MEDQNKNNEDNKTPESNESGRRDFLKFGVLAAGLTVAGVGLQKVFSGEKNSDEKASGEKVKVLTTDGKLIEVYAADVKKADACCVPSAEARQGIPGKKFVMVIDLSRCKDALKCQKSCEKHHQLPEQDKWLKVFKMQESEETAPYWMPKPCFHCDHPPCVKVCPVDATFKRTDGIVLVDNERCIGCRFCMAACPYSARVFNWSEPVTPARHENDTYSPETSTPRKKGTVEKCDFCPDVIRQGKLPHCVTACPNGVYYFGDQNEDTVTNGDTTVRLSQLLRDKAGYRYLESLGTEPSVYYLPAANRIFPFKDREIKDEKKEESKS